MSASGFWYNELGSRMQLQVSGSDIWGWYYTAVGYAYGTYPLEGQINTDPYPFSQVLGWAVAWNNAYLNSHSLTTWSGQYQTVDDEEEIIAFWLLTSEMKEAEDWAATNIGKDTFKRIPPDDKDIDKARKRRAKSNP